MADVRLIDANALIDDLNTSGIVLAMTGDEKGSKLAKVFVKIVKDHAEEKSVDAVPVVHARWIHGVTFGHEWRKCSECLVSQNIFGCFKYCPNCGAKMDGGVGNG